MTSRTSRALGSLLAAALLPAPAAPAGELRRAPSGPLHAARAAATPRPPAGAVSRPAPATDTRPAPGADRSRESVARAVDAMPMRFEPNVGQFPAPVDFVARSSRYTLFLAPGEAVLSLALSARPAPRADGLARPGESESITRTAEPEGIARSGETEIIARSAKPEGDASTAALRMRLVGANREARAQGVDRRPGATSYLVGSDPSAWRTGVPAFGAVRYDGVYDGVDAVYYGAGRQLEYDFVVRPGGRVDAIRLAFDGARSARIDAGGDLVLELAGGELVQKRPFTYQEREGARREVASRYVALDGGGFGFAVGEYDPSLPLVVDPVLSYSTFLGAASEDACIALAANEAGECYVTGLTNSARFPTEGAFEPTYQGGGNCPQGLTCGDAFVTKLDADAKEILYSTYIGGRNGDLGYGIAVDAAGAVYVAGETDSPDFPVVGGAFQSRFGGLADAFVLKLNAQGSSLIYSTFVGGSYFEKALNLAIDPAGYAYIVGVTNSNDFPLVNAVRTTGRGPEEGFVTKVSPSGSSVVYSTYLGGEGDDVPIAVAADAAGAAYVAGHTTSPDFPRVRALQTALLGSIDAFVTKLTAAGAIDYSTLYGGRGEEDSGAIALDAQGNAYVIGSTNSTDFPTANAIYSHYSGGQPVAGGGPGLGDAFVLKLVASGSSVVYATYLGGSRNELGLAGAVDSTGAVYAMGITSSPNFPTLNAVQGSIRSEIDAWVTKIAPDGHSLVYSTFLGGSDNENVGGGSGIYIDFSGNAYLCGLTFSHDYPVTEGALQTTYGGGYVDGMISKIVDYYDLTWAPPDPAAGPGAPPRFLTADRAEPSARKAAASIDPELAPDAATGDPQLALDTAAGERAAAAPPAAAPGQTVTGYKIFRSAKRGTPPDPSNIFASVPAAQTHAAHVPGGASFAVAACYADGSMSAASSFTSGGNGEADLQTLDVAKSGITARGTRFTSRVTVTVDGVAFQQPATVSADGTVVTQGGRLANGMTLKKYAKRHAVFSVSFRNATGGVATVTVSR